MKGILGKKIGMTQVFNVDGKAIPVTVIEVGKNVVTQIKAANNEGYDAIQLGYSDKRDILATSAHMGHVKKANTSPKRFLKEIRGVDVSSYELGQTIDASLFEAGEVVDVTGTSKGKGFAGVIKRHNQTRGPMTHGSHFHRSPGSMGTMRPMRVFKGKNLPGHMGVETVTIQNLEIIETNIEDGYILVSGNVPGAKNSLVVVRTAIKNPIKKEANQLVSYITEEEVSSESNTEESTEEVVVDETNNIESVIEEETKESSQE